MTGKATILVIEDDASIRDHMVRMLGFEGYDVIAASDGGEGVRSTREMLPDVIVCDLLMPGVNGFGACRVLRDYPTTASIPTIVVSALNAESDRKQAQELGVSAYLHKPFRNQELIKLIELCLKRREA